MDKKSTTSMSREKSGNDNKSTSGTSKSKGKGKKAKAKEEEERKRLEEEERLRKEQEEKANKEREAKENEESKKRELRISELKNRELTEFYDLMNQFNEKISKFHKNERAQAEWGRYIKCDGLPNPTLPAEINTFMTLWKEDKENNDIANSYKFTDISLKLIQELQSVIHDVTGEENFQKKVDDYNKIINDLENVLWTKINEASHRLLCDASIHTDPETLNFDYAEGTPNLFYCVWSNLSHNPRITKFSFGTKNFSFTLPRALTLAHVTIRVLFMNFDIYSSHSKTYKCQTKVEKYEFDPIPQSTIDKNVDEVKKEVTEEDFLPPELRALMEKSDLAKKSAEEAERKEQENLEAKKLEKEKAEKLEAEKNETKKIDPVELSILQELSDNYVIDLRNYMPIGPILNFGIYNIPPQPRKVKQWTITQKDHIDVLSPYVYPSPELKLVESSWQDYLKRKNEPPQPEEPSKKKTSDILNSTIKSDVLDSTIGAEEHAKAAKIKAEGPLHIVYKMPTNVYYGEAPILARWDSKKKHWRTDEIMDFIYNEEQREISFNTYHFSPYCLLQDRHVHMPIQSWRLTPKSSIDTCTLFIEASSFELTIEIRNSEVRLYIPPKKVIEEDPKSKKQTPLPTMAGKKTETPKEELDTDEDKFRKIVEPFANNWFTLDKFINILKSVGLNIFPEPDSEKFVTITTKNKKIEWQAYQNIALCSCLMAFSFSRWNMEINDENKIVVSSLLHSIDAPPNQEDFKCLVFTKDLIKLTETDDSSDKFSENCSTGTEEHADLFHLCCELCRSNETLVNRITQLNPHYLETCIKLLESTKIISFS